jgi:hypothetical protein
MPNHERRYGEGSILSDDKAYADELARQMEEGIIFAGSLDGRDLEIFAEYHPELIEGDQDAA